ncbi:hypothetical protein RSOLAG1IB_12167 [Rhizoctonia solani AG-1 IB]|uniref:Uncharacterized protein n=1 Tax=Thanatephorus cucumeris (strain AG1-IB / isolate 7/3/14) TaxID=1108050 RepID=M5CDN6_THACB|nr:hypothetical protein BN14_11410 [Rhizoctonia solani AG-1 IB]CEL58623.1 hypothetical protein RSOLAG1IB_12167 [Rhizoctonia solani AG-1 IB]
MPRPACTPEERAQRKQQIQQALLGLRRRTYKTAKAAARAFNLDAKVLRDRLHGRRRPDLNAQAPRQLLTQAQSASSCITLIKEKLAEAETRAEQAEAHARIMAHWNAEQQCDINAKKTVPKKKLNTDAQLITGNEAMAICRQEEREEERRQAEEIATWNKQLECKKDQRQAEQEANAPSITWTVAWH